MANGEQTIGQAVIQVTAEADGVATGFAEGVQAANNFGNAMERLGDQTRSGLGAASTAIDASEKAQQRWVRQTERQIAVLQMSESELARYDARVRGISDALSGPYLQTLDIARRAHAEEAAAVKRSEEALRQANRVKADAEAADRRAADAKAAYIARLREEVATAGMTPNQRELRRAGQEGGQEAVQLALQRQNIEAATRARQEEGEAARRAAQEVIDAAKRKQDADASAKRTHEAYLESLREEGRLARLTADQREQRVAGQRGGNEAAQIVAQNQNIRAQQEALNRQYREQQAALNAAENARRSFVSSVQAEANAIGKTRSQLLEEEAARRGVSQQLAPQIAAIRAHEAALGAQGKALAANGMSMKAYQAALRGVPAQITDIVVSLQGGQAPLTVFLQQGGQLRDMFGSVGAAARALGGALGSLLLNPIVVASAALLGLGAAFLKASSESDAFNKTLATTNNYAGVTARGLDEIAAAQSRVVGTRGQANEALTALVATGQVAGLQDLTRFAETAVIAQRSLGTAVADTAKAYADLAKDPIRASERLNESMRYLTLSTYDQIKSLQDAGRETEAAAAAQDAYDNAVRRSASQIDANLSPHQRAWKSLKATILDVADAVVNAFRGPTNAERLDDLQKRLQNAQRFDSFAGTGAATTSIQNEMIRFNSRLGRAAQNAADASRRLKEEQEAIGSGKAIDAISKQIKGQQNLNKELAEARQHFENIRKVNANDARLRPENIKAVEDQIRKNNTPAAGRKPAAYQDDEATKVLQRLREQEQVLKEQLDTGVKLTEAEKELVRFNQLMADLRGKKLTDDQKSLVAKESEIRAQLEINAGISRQVEDMKEKTREQERARQAAEREADAYDRIRISMAGSAESRRDAIERGLQGFGSSDRVRAQLETERQITREYQRRADDVRKAAASNNSTPERLANELAEVRAQRSIALAEWGAYYERLRQLEQDWSLGASRALESYFEETQNIAGQMENAFNNAFRGIEDTITTFVTTGKLSFSDLANSIVADITRIIVRAQIVGPLAQSLQGQMSGGSGFGGWLSGLFGSMFGGGAVGPQISSMGAASLMPGFAGGGIMGPNSFREVNERGPELLQMRGRTYLMTGSDGGQVTPMRAGRSYSPTFVLNPPPGMDRRAGRQFLADAAREFRVADTMNN